MHCVVLIGFTRLLVKFPVKVLLRVGRTQVG
jgi:hypothetical protein